MEQCTNKNNKEIKNLYITDELYFTGVRKNKDFLRQK